MFQLLPCSICQRTFSLRKDVPEESLLKCPNCGNQFRLGDVLDAFYSPWILLDEASNQDNVKEKPIGAPTDSVLSFDNLLDTHTPAAPTSNRDNAVTDDPVEVAADNLFESDLEFSNKATHDTNASLADDLELDTLDTLEDAGLELDSAGENELSDALKSEPNEFHSLGSKSATEPAVKKPRVRKSDRGGLWLIIQYVLGGAAAIPVTLLLLWYGFGQDIAGAGPAVAQYAPWIVPKKLQYPAENVPARKLPRVPPPALGEGGFRNFDEELGTKSANDAPKDVAEVTVSTDTQEPASGETEDTGMRTAFEAVRAVKQKIKEWDPKSPDNPANIKTLFEELVTIAEQMPVQSQEGGATRLLKDDLKSIGRFVASPSVRGLFAAQQATQFNDTAASTAGRVYLGLAKKVDKADGHWIITAGVANDPASAILIEVPEQDIESLPVEQPFFCMGIASDTSATSSGEGAPKSNRISAKFFQPIER